MENHFYHIRWAPLSVTIFITHMRILRNGSYANGKELKDGKLFWKLINTCIMQYDEPKK